jgi:hypothetical protein
MSESAEGGSYEVLRKRLEESARAMVVKIDALDGRRSATFGGGALALLGPGRLRTEGACVPVDAVMVGGLVLVGLQTTLGLRKEVLVDDVLTLAELVDGAEGLVLERVTDARGAWLSDARFLKDLRDLFSYYRDAKLLRLRVDEGLLLAVFRLGERSADQRVFHWEVKPDGVRYVDNRGDRQLALPPSHELTWTPTTREDHRLGRYPHVSIRDQVFVETIGGDLTIKVENNTEDGAGVYREPVDDPRQSLDDAAIEHSAVGALLLLRIKPYGEATFRYFVFHTRTQEVHRLDGLGFSCARLPEDHGVVFPGGYALDTGEVKTFAGPVDRVLDRVVRAPNGEDVLYVLRGADGRFVLYPYNLVRREVASPIEGFGAAMLGDGRVVLIRADAREPVRVHALQIWQTAFCSREHEAARPRGTGLLGRVGNADLVRGIADAYALSRRVALQPTRAVFADTVSAAGRLIDEHPWLKEEEAGKLDADAGAIRATAEAILGEYDKIEQLRRRAVEVVAKAEKEFALLAADVRPDLWRDAAPYLTALARLRRARGHVGTLREVRFVDAVRLARLEAEATALFERTARDAARFLSQPEALAGVRGRIDEQTRAAEAATRSPELAQVAERVTELVGEVEALGEVAGNLPVDDPTLRTALVQRTAEVTSLVNRARATLSRRKTELETEELRGEFGARFALLSQSVDAALAAADTPERCDEQLTRLMLQIEELEGRFGELEEFLPQVAARREEVQAAFEGRRQQLVDQRQRRVGHLVEAAERVLAGVVRRAASFTDMDDLRAFFAGDAMSEKVRALSAQIGALGDPGRGEELLGRLKGAEQTALRGLKDRSELYEGDGRVLRLGAFRFAVQPLAFELTLVPRAGELMLHLSGTDFFEPVVDEEVLGLRDVWEHGLVSESPELYRAEYLAGTILLDAEAGREGQGLTELLDRTVTPDGLLAVVQQAASRRFDEGYERGVHDADAAKILGALLGLIHGVGRLRWPADARALGLAWWLWGAGERRAALQARVRSLSALRADLGDARPLQAVAEVLGPVVAAFRDAELPEIAADPALAAAWLVEELSRPELRPVLSGDADTLVRAVQARWGGATLPGVDAALLTVGERVALARAWARAVAATDRPEAAVAEVEAAVALAAGDSTPRKVSSAPVVAEVEGLLGQHARVQGGRLVVRLDDLLARVTRHRGAYVPRWERWRAARHTTLERARARLRLDELKPRPMTSFVRNRLIQDVYLPLFGANLAKQLGASGEGKRTDQMGLLLLISPPGYGKTTLMEYLAQRLGLVFVKVNGPSLGHAVTSLDPAEAPDMTSRQEVEKIGLALEMASNVMLYLDDIQHTNPELLQKFISLCDGTRRVEGVWKGKSRTYDLRGKRFCIVMAGNPYTESGEQFKIPDMLANRADTYNLGDILGGSYDAFAESYVENAVTSNPTLAPIAARAPEDLRVFLRLAGGQEVEDSAFSHDWTAAERQDIVAVLKHLRRVQHTLLQVNQTYIASAATADSYRLEPPFKLQGSYRNMGKLAEKVVPAMTDAEVEQLITDHYAGESQTLTTGAESNLLRLGELRGSLTPAQSERWGQIKQDWRRLMLVGGTDDPAAKVTGALLGMAERLEGRLGVIGERMGSQAGVETRLGAIADAVRGGGSGVAAAMQGAGEVARGLDGLVKLLTADVVPPLKNTSARVGRVADALGGEGALVQRLGVLEGVLAAVFADLGADTPAARGRQAALVGDVAEGGWLEVGEGADVHAPTGALQPGKVSWAPAPVNGRAAVGAAGGQAAGGQPGAEVKPELVDPVLAATVPVIRDLALRMSRLVRRLVPADQQAAALQALKEDVAQVAAALASARAKGG